MWLGIDSSDWRTFFWVVVAFVFVLDFVKMYIRKIQNNNSDDWWFCFVALAYAGFYCLVLFILPEVLRGLGIILEMTGSFLSVL